jgi:hypothetical protein
MSVLNYLQRCASETLVDEREREKIDRSILNLKERLDAHFGEVVADQFRFGSTTRGTNLPRAFDESSDVDYMIVFRDTDKSPQTYLDRLRTFAERVFPRSAVRQSHPSVVLELAHINFDLVPAINTWWHGLRIPDKEGSWQHTDPHGFNEKLTLRNAGCGNLLKPAIRIIKRWNAANRYVFDSYELERRIVSNWYPGCSSLTDYVFTIFKDMSVSGGAQRDVQRIARARERVASIRSLEANSQGARAEREISKLVP